MKLLVDIGNTRSKFALANAGQLSPTQSIKHQEVSPALFQRLFPDNPAIESVWVSCVGPEQAYAEVENWVVQQFALNPNRVSVSDISCGISNGYQDQAKLGVDRWVAAIGARQMIDTGDLIIIDAGTAVTIDWLDQGNVYQGGVIIPGYALMHQSLTGNTEGIDSMSEPTELVIGKTTKQCVNAGLSYGLVGSVEKIVEEITNTIAAPVSLVLTGGGAPLLINRSELEFQYEPQLLMRGLSRMAQQ